MTFRVGQKVEQIKPWSDPATGYPDVRFTECGVTYTIREIVEVKGTTALRFFELRNPPRIYRDISGLIEQPFPAWNFRPVVERKTDIGFAHEILCKASKRVPNVREAAQ